MTGNTDKQNRFWTQQEIKSWHPKAKEAGASRDRKTASTAVGRKNPAAKSKRSDK